jgi:hypothetical protein
MDGQVPCGPRREEGEIKRSENSLLLVMPEYRQTWQERRLLQYGCGPRREEGWIMVQENSLLLVMPEYSQTWQERRLLQC